MNNYIEIDGRKIGKDYPPYLIAELSANHNGKLDRALDTIRAAKRNGADAIKLQTYTADTLTIDSKLDDFQIKDGPWCGYNLYELYKWAETPYEWHKEMFECARQEEITCFSTPFDETAVDLLEDLNAPAYKIASFEAVDLPLIKYAAATKKPMIISTGMANFEEIQEAVVAAKEGGCRELILLHCISSYPAPIEQSNLRTILDLEKKFGVQVGLSDHSIGNTAAIAAVALGACFVEKHFMLDRTEDGPDSSFSIIPEELLRLSIDLKDSWLSLGTAGYERKLAEEGSVKFRRSLYFISELKEGDIIRPENIRRIRPGYGLSPKFLDDVIGKKVSKNIDVGTAVNWDLLEK